MSKRQQQRQSGWPELAVTFLILLAIARVAGYPGHPARPGGHQPEAASVVAVKVPGNSRPGIPYLGTTLPPESVMIRWFGQPADPSQEATVPFAGHTVQVNRALAANVRELGRRLAAAGYAGYIRDVGGFRESVGASGSPIPFSMHQFGAAFDINEDGGPDGDWHTMTLPAGLVSIAASMGWFCGQAWDPVSRDGGHFQFSGGLR